MRARPLLGSTRHVGWYRALDDDLAALRATLQHTLVDDPSASGVALAARLGVYWAFSGMGVEGDRWLRTAADACTADPGLGRPADRAAVHVDLGARLLVQGRVTEGGAQVRAGIAEGAGVTGDDAVLVCASLTVAAGAVARAGDRELLAELAAAMHRTAAGSAALDVASGTSSLVHATIVEPSPGLVAQYLALHRDARSEDNLFTAWLTAANAARLMLAAGRAAEAVTWARAAVRASAEAGLRTTRTRWRSTAPRSAGPASTPPRCACSAPSRSSTAARAWCGPGTERRRAHRRDDRTARRGRGRASPVGGRPGHAGGARRGLTHPSDAREPGPPRRLLHTGGRGPVEGPLEVI